MPKIIHNPMPNDDMLGVCQLCGLTFPHIHHDDTKPKEFEMISRPQQKDCKYCCGKGTYSRMVGERAADDFGDESKYSKPPTIQNFPCPRCIKPDERTSLNESLGFKAGFSVELPDVEEPKKKELPQEFIPWPNAYAVIQRKYEKGDDSIMVNPHTCELAIFVNLGTAKILLDVLRQKTENTIEYAIVEVIIEPMILPITPLI